MDEVVPGYTGHPESEVIRDIVHDELDALFPTLMRVRTAFIVATVAVVMLAGAMAGVTLAVIAATH